MNIEKAMKLKKGKLYQVSWREQGTKWLNLYKSRDDPYGMSIDQISRGDIVLILDTFQNYEGLWFQVIKDETVGWFLFYSGLNINEPEITHAQEA